MPSTVLTYDKDGLVFAPASAFLAPYDTVDAPDEITDIYDQKSPYNLVTGWIAAGATAGPAVIHRNITTAGPTIQQSQTAVFEDVQTVERTLEVQFAEFSEAMLEVLEQSVATSSSARTKVPFGSIPTLANYRLALWTRRSRQQGTVQEGSTLASATLRGRDLLWVGYNAALTGNDVAISIARGETSAGTLTFKLSPDPDFTTTGAEEGYWLDELAHTIP